MKPFHFKQFSVQQSAKVFRVGTDGVLLGASASVQDARKILEIGTGTGLIALMVAQRNAEAIITAIEINEYAAAIAAENFRSSPFYNRLKVLQHDFKSYNVKDKFDIIISNPPYFKINPSEKDILARQQTELSFGDLISNASQILSESGTFSVIIPFDAGNDFEKRCRKEGLFLVRKTTIFGIQNASPKRLILEFGFENKKITETELVIEKSPRRYSDDYLALTQDFHVFGK